MISLGECERRPMSVDEGARLVHLMIGDKDGPLNGKFASRFPLLDSTLVMNVPATIEAHFRRGEPDTHTLASQLDATHPVASRLLLASVEEYTTRHALRAQRHRVARGAFGAVFAFGGATAVKEIPAFSHDGRCVFVDVYNEVRILSKLVDVEGVIKLLDYGRDPYVFWLCMPLFEQNAREWRHEKGLQLDKAMHILERVATTLAEIHGQHGISHCDVRGANVLLRPLGESPSDMSVVLADFGSAVESQGSYECTWGRGGVDGLSAPESRAAEADEVGVPIGCADVWSLGCLLFELLTDAFLLLTSDDTPDWSATGLQLENALEMNQPNSKKRECAAFRTLIDTLVCPQWALRPSSTDAMHLIKRMYHIE